MLSKKFVSRGFVAAAFYLLSVCTVSLGSLSGVAAAQATASLSLEPGSSSVQQDGTLSVTIYTNSGTQKVNAVSAILNYDTSKLEYVSTTKSGTAFAGDVSNSANGSTVKVERYVTVDSTPPSGKAKVATVNFKAKASSGSTDIVFAASSVVAAADGEQAGQNIWNGNTTGGTYSFTAKPADTPSTGGNNPANPSQPSNPTTPKPDPGNDNNNNGNDTPADGNSSGDQEEPQTEENLPPTFMVAVKVVDKSNKPIEGAEVELGNMKATSDATGIASFFNVEAGAHEVKIKSKAGVLSATVMVKDDVASTEVQLFDLRVEPAARPAWLTVALGVVVVGLLGVAAFLGFTRFRGGRPNTPTSPGSGGTPTPPSSSPLDGISGPAAPPPGSVINAG